MSRGLLDMISIAEAWRRCGACGEVNGVGNGHCHLCKADALRPLTDAEVVAALWGDWQAVEDLPVKP